MARADKSALISKAVAALRAKEFADYSKAAACFGVDRTCEETGSHKVVTCATTARRIASLIFHLAY